MKNTRDFLTSMMRQIVPETNVKAKHMHKRIRQMKDRFYRANGNQPLN